MTLSIPEFFFKRLEASSLRRGMSRSQRALELMERQLGIEELVFERLR